MFQYRENNIIFRIASADAISQFKSVQAHSFIQICRKDFDFDRSAREVLLLSYDRFSKWMLQIEQDFLAIEDHVITKDFIDFTYKSISVVLNDIENVCINNTQIFSKNVSDFLKIIHSYSLHLIGLVIEGKMFVPLEKSFTELMSMVSDYLQHLLIALHEFDNNLAKQKQPFVCISEFSALSYKHSMSCSPVIDRVKFFNAQNFNDEFMIKNYSKQDLRSRVVKQLNDIGIRTYEEPSPTANV